MILQLILVSLLCKIYGHPEVGGRIVGGLPVDISVRPYQLSLQYVGSHICGASLINPKNVLTAAHCVFQKHPLYLTAYGGSSMYNSAGVRRQAAQIIIHKNYNDDTSDFDIAIVGFSQAFGYTSKLLPVALPFQGEPIPRKAVGIVSGWGYTREDLEVLSPILLEIRVSIVSRVRCSQLFMGKGIITRRMFCAGDVKGGIDACQGDSGGPLVVNNKLTGIVSWGYGCARPGYPGVYTKVSNFVNWINNNTVC